MRIVVVCLVALLLTGCAPKKPPESLPTYEWVGEEKALADLRARAAAVKTVSAECTITLTRADGGETVKFDGALAMQNPGWLRLRAWKFNRAVFDLTLQPAGLWIMTMDDPARKEQLVPATLSASELVKQWSYFNGRLFEESNQATIAGDVLVVRRAGAKDGGFLYCEVDRVTLTPRRYATEPHVRPPFELQLSGYQDVGGVLWPTRLVATGEMGTVTVEQRNVEINGELAENAFTPPRRAEKWK